MAEHIVHELPVPQSVQDLRAACGLPAVTVRHGDQVHHFAYTTQPEYVTCIGCLAVRELTAARTARGRLHVDTIWYEQTTEGARLRGEVDVRLSTGGDHYHRTVALGPESYQSARRLAERLGLELQVALDLRERVAEWEGGAA